MDEERVFRLIIPRNDNSGAPVRAEVFRDAALMITQRFGGVTVYPRIAGCYVPKGKSEPECDLSTEMLTVVAPADRKGAEEFFQDLGDGLALALGQESIMEQQQGATITRFEGRDIYAPAAQAGLTTGGRPVNRNPDALFGRLYPSAPPD